MRFLHFILSHSVFIAFCALALCFQTSVLLHFDVDIYLYVFVFFATLCSYNFYWMLGSYNLARSSPTAFLKKHYTNIIFFFISAVGLVVCMLHVKGLIQLAAIAVLLTLAYAVPLMPFKALHFTRRAGFLKTILLSFTWAFVTVYIPCRLANVPSVTTIWLLFGTRFLFMLMLCIIFDKRDAQLDKIRGLHSLATDVNKVTLRYIMLAIFIAFMVNGILLRTHFKDFLQIAALMVTGIVTVIVYLCSQKKQGYFFYYFLVDGLMLFSALTTYVASI
jgi:4-hydroxybenzoate polyprenyltransferase